MTFYITSFDYKSNESNHVSRGYFYNKFVFPEIPEDLMLCQGKFLQSIYKDVLWSQEQNLVNGLCEFHMEFLGKGFYGEVTA